MRVDGSRFTVHSRKAFRVPPSAGADRGSLDRSIWTPGFVAESGKRKATQWIILTPMMPSASTLSPMTSNRRSLLFLVAIHPPTDTAIHTAN